MTRSFPVPERPTGVGFIPHEGGPEILYEHAHRYLIGRHAVVGMTVVDLGSGEGCGAALLAEVAREVIGIDIDQSSIECAAALFTGGTNIRFAVGAIESVPLADACADAVTCFETIEHSSNPRLVVEEVVRILKPGGIFLVSTPRVDHTGHDGVTKEFHSNESYLAEFEHLLSEYFEERVILGQRLIAGSVMWPLDEKSAHEPRARASNILVTPFFDEGRPHGAQSMIDPMNVLAVCRVAGAADGDLPLPAISVLIDPQELLLDAFRHGPATVEAVKVRLNERDAELEQARTQLGDYEDRLAGLQLECASIGWMRARVEQQDAELDKARTQLVAYEDRLVSLRAESTAGECERAGLLDQLAAEQAERAKLLRRLHLEQDERSVAAAALELERATAADLRSERDGLSAELEGERSAEERRAPVERGPVGTLCRLIAQRFRRR